MRGSNILPNKASSCHYHQNEKPANQNINALLSRSVTLQGVVKKSPPLSGGGRGISSSEETPSDSAYHHVQQTPQGDWRRGHKLTRREIPWTIRLGRKTLLLTSILVAMAPIAPPRTVVATGTRLFVTMATTTRTAAPRTAQDKSCPLSMRDYLHFHKKDQAMYVFIPCDQCHFRRYIFRTCQSNGNSFHHLQ